MIASDVVSIRLTTPTVDSVRNYPTHITIDELRHRQEIITGIPAGMAHFHVHGAWFSPSHQDFKVGALIPVGENSLHVQVSISKDPSSQMAVEDVEKYEMPEQVYDQLHDSVRAFKRRNKLGQFADQKEEAVQDLSMFQPGSRCCVKTEGLDKLGWVRFAGKLKGKKGAWIGVEYDEPVGKHNGTVDSEVIFQCRDKHGAFVRPDKVVLGEFDEEDYEI